MPTGSAAMNLAPLPPSIAPLTDARAAIVWQAGGTPVKSVWVEPAAGSVVVKHERSEPVVATRRDLFALRITRGTTAAIDAIPLRGGSSIALVSETVETCPPTDEEATVTLDGAMGSVVFVKAHGWIQECDATHPQWGDPANVYDLETDTDLPLAPFPGLARLQKLVHGKFMAELGEDGGGCLMAPKATPALYTATFTYDGRGVLHGRYLFTMDSNYMCGTGPGHYAAQEELFDSSLPDTVGRWKNAPAWLAPYLAKHPSLGVSPLPVELDIAAAATEFTIAPMPAPSSSAGGTRRGDHDGGRR
jgi:hypothetical protein